MSIQKTVVVFFTPHDLVITGGIISIFSLAAESRKILGDSADVYLCVFPGNKAYGKNTLFPNNETVIDFSDMQSNEPSPSKLILNFPEYAVQEFTDSLQQFSDYISGAGELQINILNQNIQIMPEPTAVAGLFAFTNNVTQTTAHQRYCTQEICDRYGVPTHHISVSIDKSNYKETPWDNKKNKILYSPDTHPMKSQIIAKLEQAFPNYSIEEIRGLSYDEYKDAVSSARFVITFGEGMDGYFIEPAFSGTLPFAVYNQEFFPDENFLQLSNVYPSYEKMLSLIVEDLQKLAKPAAYNRALTKTVDLLEGFYSLKTHHAKLAKFYEGKFDFCPQPEALAILLHGFAKQTAGIASQMQGIITSYEDKINSTSKELIATQSALRAVLNSKSWRLTKPLRAFTSCLRINGRG